MGLTKAQNDQLGAFLAAIPPHESAYVRQLILQESNGEPTARSGTGARGLGQFVRGTWEGTDRYLKSYRNNFDRVLRQVPNLGNVGGDYDQNWSDPVNNAIMTWVHTKQLEQHAVSRVNRAREGQGLQPVRRLQEAAPEGQGDAYWAMVLATGHKDGIGRMARAWINPQGNLDLDHATAHYDQLRSRLDQRAATLESQLSDPNLPPQRRSQIQRQVNHLRNGDQRGHVFGYALQIADKTAEAARSTPVQITQEQQNRLYNYRLQSHSDTNPAVRVILDRPTVAALDPRNRPLTGQPRPVAAQPQQQVAAPQQQAAPRAPQQLNVSDGILANDPSLAIPPSVPALSPALTDPAVLEEERQRIDQVLNDRVNHQFSGVQQPEFDERAAVLQQAADARAAQLDQQARNAIANNINVRQRVTLADDDATIASLAAGGPQTALEAGQVLQTVGGRVTPANGGAAGAISPSILNAIQRYNDARQFGGFANQAQNDVLSLVTPEVRQQLDRLQQPFDSYQLNDHLLRDSLAYTAQAGAIAAQAESVAGQQLSRLSEIDGARAREAISKQLRQNLLTQRDNADARFN